MSPSIAIVSGANGFVGSRVTVDLLHAGWLVYGLVRRADAPVAPGVQRLSTECDADRAALTHAMQAGTDLFVHCAGEAHLSSHAARCPRAYEHNARGARELAALASEAGVRTFVLLSSIAAAVEEAAGTRCRGREVGQGYGASKLAGERAAFDVLGGTNTRCFVMRAPMIYGPGMRGNPLRVFRWLSRGRPLPVPTPDNRRSLVYVSTLTEAILALHERASRTSGIYEVADADVLSTAEFIRLAAAALGVRARLLPIPSMAIDGLLRMHTWLWPTKPSASLESLHRSFGSLVVDQSALEADSGYRARHRIDEGLRASADWFRTAGGVA